MRSLFSLLLLALLSSALAAPSAQAKLGSVTYTARPGAVFAQKGGQEMWRRTNILPGASSIQMVAYERTVVILSIQDKKIVLTGLSAGNGTRLWQTNIIDEDSTTVRLRGATGNVALLTSVWGPPRITRVMVVSLGDGGVLYKKPGDLLGFQGRYAALLDYGLNLEVPSNAWLPLVRLDLAQAKRTYIGITIPQRPGCGPVFSRNPGKPDLKYDDKYITAFRKDSCGLFTVKVDWHGRPGQAAIISPMIRR